MLLKFENFLGAYDAYGFSKTCKLVKNKYSVNSLNIALAGEYFILTCSSPNIPYYYIENQHMVWC